MPCNEFWNLILDGFRYFEIKKFFVQSSLYLQILHFKQNLKNSKK